MKYQVLPDLTPIEYEALKADIAERGVLVSVEIDENGEVLDGHHRVRAYNELMDEGIQLPDYPRVVRTGLTEDEKYIHSLSLNVNRRQLTDEQITEAQREMRRRGMKYQAIADATGVSRGTAYNRTHDVELSKNGKLMGADGKLRPASYERHDYREPEADGQDGMYLVEDEPDDIPVPEWTESELTRRGYIENGMTVIANMKTDLALIAWAKSNELFERIDRATEWGNPFLLPQDGDRLTVVENYQWYLERRPSLLNKIPQLQGKVLGCWCYPEMCHGEVLQEFADDTAD